MSFAVHTFEINPSGDPTGFAFHEEAGEGRELYFLSKFGTGTPEARNIAENIFGMVLESLRNSKAVDPYDQFEDALKAANAEARKHAKSFTKVPNFVIAFFDFHHLYLSQTGESEAYLVRGASVSQISETVDDGQELFQNILSGQVAVDDTVLLTSSRLLRSVTASEMADIFSQSDFSEAVATLRAKLTTTTDEDLVVTTIGVAKKEETPSAGFLSKVVSKGKEVVQKTKKKSSKMSVLPKQEEAPRRLKNRLRKRKNQKLTCRRPFLWEPLLKNFFQKPSLQKRRRRKKLLQNLDPPDAMHLYGLPFKMYCVHSPRSENKNRPWGLQARLSVCY